MTLLPPLPLQDGKLFFSSSFLDTFDCPRKAQHYGLDRRVSSGSSAGMLFGSHIHEALSLRTKLSEYGLTNDQINQKVSDLLTNLFREEPQAEGDFRNLNWAMEVYQRYCVWAQVDEWVPLRFPIPQKCRKCDGEGIKLIMSEKGSLAEGIPFDDGPCIWCNGTGHYTIMSEISFAVHLFDYHLPYTLSTDLLTGDTIRIYLHGIIDQPVTLRRNLFPADYKTSSRMDNDFWRSQESSAQWRQYCFGLRELGLGDPKGTLIRGIRTAEPPKYVREGTVSKRGEKKTIRDFWQESFQEQRFDLGEGDLDEWKNNAIHKIETFLWHYGRGYFPRNEAVCVGKFGPCTYRDVCNTYPLSDRIRILNSDKYKDKENKMQQTNTTTTV